MKAIFVIVGLLLNLHTHDFPASYSLKEIMNPVIGSRCACGAIMERTLTTFYDDDMNMYRRVVEVTVTEPTRRDSPWISLIKYWFSL